MTNPSRPGHSAVDDADDAEVVVISFPKCGRTWLRVMMAKAISAHWGLPMELCADLRLPAFSEVEPRVPRIIFWHDDRVAWRTPEELSGDKGWYHDRKVVFLTRDLRDTIVSQYFQRSRRPGDPYPGELGAFLTERRGSLRTCVEFWNIWHAARAVPDGFLLTSYERLGADTAGELARVLEFCGLPAPGAGTLREAVEFGGFGRMRGMELADAFRSERLRPGRPDDPESFKTRRGVVGGHRDYLSAAQIAWADALITERLVPAWQPLALAADLA
ncbi:sulfotransferase domain-containing protein [Kitasatospora sp. NBC_01287]|uniref:sulfotransferase domain-containing protein n=1 Tax=Kitasatospora sp. NBC_01287 TaxID=2903573 RepID=UPI0022595E6A|nr:sulfotransferase domain-containing protein [Kitasatospora sp. NBC_01287]MCX4750381.1 sulfotransferase domain-containing protein [Kitasatospora sp. NBC_01287]